MKIKEAAKVLGVNPQFLRVGLQQERFPFGFAVKMKKHWAYHIDEGKLRDWMKGKSDAEQA